MRFDRSIRRSEAERAERLKRAVLLSFSRTGAEIELSLAGHTPKDWENILFWLDISGLALYLLDRVVRLRVSQSLPDSILLRLQNNLEENRNRTASLFQEAATISHSFEAVKIPYALLKGITLSPESVSDPALRWQTDLDFLVNARDAVAARHLLEAYGYGLNAISGETFEFKAGVLGKPDIRNIYRVHSQRTLELHVRSVSPKHRGEFSDLLARSVPRQVQGVTISTLSAADILVQQGVHLFKHLCGEHTRASWVLEFWRHTAIRQEDKGFWGEVDWLLQSDPAARVALGAASLLTSLSFGGPIPRVLKECIEDLPRGVRLWVETYGERVLLAGTPGNKLYLLLRKQLQNGGSGNAEVRRLAFPIHLPARITRGERGTGFSRRMSRVRIEVGYTLSRLSFHVIEGMKFALESARWQRLLGETLR